MDLPAQWLRSVQDNNKRARTYERKDKKSRQEGRSTTRGGSEGMTIASRLEISTKRLYNGERGGLAEGGRGQEGRRREESYAKSKETK